MYAFGDVRNPNPAAAAILEEMTIDFLIDLCMRARPSPLAVPQVDQSYPPVGRLKVKVDDFKHALRKDPKKLNRLEELLYMDTQIKQTKKTLDVDQFAKDEAEQQQRLFAEAAAQSSMAEPQKESETNALADESEESQRTAKRRKSTAETAGKGSKKGKGKERESGRGRSGSPTAMEE
ncbi:TFIID-18kDa-domain-containing protein [Tilletiaria anomala UBC 951]|uniref:Transcription initiation factor TFIID subunit 13 n=1 Tax=Tilletiaria anomala (strain ATCC 24038 / CBS 436.72 / UBC 951) TaxID=1037660 RepID=A0A066VN01_TILAU|nr:TFIID-18kDa-domain-containing protein [Tilletiaria anomala UBC 951]KDN41668.1 TFIID-18kDa-domain-containing protein [Tilletiaria anomala UBC 951]